MAARGIEVHVLPATATFAEIAALQPDGVFFSNGPGDPAAADDEIDLLREVLDARPAPSSASASATRSSAARWVSAPTSCATATAASTSRSRTAPPGKVEITAQNHGFAVDAPVAGADTATRRGGCPRLARQCLNDDVVEGLE
jgi:carbamoyl-phosphate synthase small subunit